MPSENDQLMAHFEVETKPRRRLFYWLLLPILVVVVLLLATPTIVTRTSLKDFLISKFLPADIASVSIGDMSFGWFAPLSIENLKITDGSNETLLEVPAINGERSLLELAKDWSDIGTVVVTSPTVHLALRPDGSNLEDTLNALMEEYPSGETETETTAISANFKLVDGRVIATDLTSGETWKLEQLNTVATMPASIESDWIVEASGQLDGTPFAARMQTALGKATDVWPLGPSGSAALQTKALPLAPMRYARHSGRSADQSNRWYADLKRRCHMATRSEQRDSATRRSGRCPSRQSGTRRAISDRQRRPAIADNRIRYESEHRQRRCDSPAMQPAIRLRQRRSRDGG